MVGWWCFGCFGCFGVFQWTLQNHVGELSCRLSCLRGVEIHLSIYTATPVVGHCRWSFLLTKYANILRSGVYSRGLKQLPIQPFPMILS